MARSFRGRRFSSSSDVGEDVNPSAYIVNLADCMLVLACGFIVALISAWDVDISGFEQLDTEEMVEIDPQEIEEEIDYEGSYYVEAGTVWRDPSTGEYYIQTGEDMMATGEGSSADGSGSGSSSGSASSSGAGTSTANDEASRQARANGAD